MLDPSVLAALPDDIELTLRVTVGELREIYARAAAQTSDGAVPRDFTLEEVAERVGRAVSTVRGWAPKIPGAYRLHGRDWRVPPDGLATYLQTQARGRAETGPTLAARPEPGADLDAWRDEVPGARRRTRRRAGRAGR